MRIPIFQVDAFADRPFEGNPAAVVPLDAWLPDDAMQAIAAENNLAETAFFVAEGDGYRLRWFTPSVEVDLCGHATLASAYVLYSKLGFRGDAVAFETRGGPLTVVRDGDGLLAMDFPAFNPEPCDAPTGLAAALGADPAALLKTRNFLAVFDTASAVAALAPDTRALAGVLGPLDMGLIATAPGDEDSGWDFVSRFFAPAHGVDEDAVTGSAHCTSVPYWASRLGKTELVARQISTRGGTLYCSDAGERVILRGRCADYLTGEVTLPD